mgnify:FL=1
MGARRISNATNEKIIALMSIGKTAESVAFATGCSTSYCNKLWTTTRYIAKGQWDELIEYSKSATTGGVIVWACEYLDTELPESVVEAIRATKYRSAQSKKEETTPESAVIDNTATAILKLLEKLDAAVNAITEAADDICQTVSTARKLNEDCINANFDVLTGTVRDGIESVKTTIRKGQK